jgi:hypothetical protein
MQKPWYYFVTTKPTEMTIFGVGKLQETSNGNRYVECKTNLGVVAVWGSAGNMGNIDAILSKTPPFKATMGCITSKWGQHNLWVPETASVHFE